MDDRRPVVVVGCSGHAKVVADCLRLAGTDIAGALDDRLAPGTVVADMTVLGGDALLDDPAFIARHRFIVAIGHQSIRARLGRRLAEQGAALATAIHPAAVVSPSAEIGAGTVVVAGAVINADARIGRWCIVNTAASIDHDCVLADGVQISPGARLAGGVRCGEDSMVGMGGLVLPGVALGRQAVVGAGAVVLADVADGATVVGIPAAPLRSGHD